MIVFSHKETSDSTTNCVRHNELFMFLLMHFMVYSRYITNEECLNNASYHRKILGKTEKRANEQGMRKTHFYFRLDTFRWWWQHFFSIRVCSHYPTEITVRSHWFSVLRSNHIINPCIADSISPTPMEEGKGRNGKWVAVPLSRSYQVALREQREKWAISLSEKSYSNTRYIFAIKIARDVVGSFCFYVMFISIEEC